MRILISGTTYAPSLNGQAIFTVNLAEGLAARGHEVTVVFPSDQSYAYRSLRNGVHLEHVRSIDLTRIHPNVRVPIPSARAISKIFDSSRPEVVHIQDHYPPSGLMQREAKKRDIWLMGSNHFMPENLAPYIPGLSMIKPLFNWLLWKWMLHTYNETELVTAQSRAAAALIRAQGLRPPIFSVSCGIDLRRFHPDATIDRVACRARHGLDPKRTIFLFVGRVDGEKRVDLLLRAMTRLHRDDIQLAVAGQGAAAKEFRALAKSLKLGDRVHFTGFIPNEELHILLNSVDVFTMPSAAELLSIASLEAMACGRPLLVADAVALPELVTQGVNGYLFKPGDAADAAHYMELLADHPERWADMGRASFERAQDHSLAKTIERYEGYYGERIKENREQRIVSREWEIGNGNRK
jgi:glycosyltransferase involved in cell wall biosynthesis